MSRSGQKKKDLKEAYRQMKPRGGVYQIRNLDNGKLFVGSGPDFKAAWNSAQFQLKNGLHTNAALQAEWTATGADHFVFEEVTEYKREEDAQTDARYELKKLEAMFMEELKPFGEKGYH